MNLSVVSTTQIAIVIAIAVMVIACIAIWFSIRKRRTERLRTRFGPEYARVVQESGGRRQGEAGLQVAVSSSHRIHTSIGTSMFPTST